MLEQNKEGKLFITPSVGSRKEVGYTKNNWLIYINTDNICSVDNSIGIDKEILTDKRVIYRFIRIIRGTAKFETTRKYFYDKSVKHDIYNGRDMLFLDKNKFGIAKAVKYENNKSFEDIAQLSIFDLEETGVSLKDYLKALDKVDETKEMKRIEL